MQFKDQQLTDDLNLISLYCTSIGLAYFNKGLPSSSTYKPDTFVFLPNIIYELAVPKNFIVIPEVNGTLIINELVKWGQLRNIGSYYNS